MAEEKKKIKIPKKPKGPTNLKFKGHIKDYLKLVGGTDINGVLAGMRLKSPDERQENLRSNGNGGDANNS